MSGPFPHLLTNLSPREAITDTIYRALIGFDNNDVPLFNSACSTKHEVIFDLDGRIFTGVDAIRSQLLDFIGPMDTTHMLSNIRVEVKDGADVEGGKASLTAYALAQHCLPGEGTQPDGRKFLAASTYAVELEKEGKLWVVVKWAMKIIWTQGDAGVMQSTG